MKPLISSLSGTLHKSLSVGCRLWEPVLPKAKDSKEIAHPTATAFTDGTRFAGSISNGESSPTFTLSNINLKKETS